MNNISKDKRLNKLFNTDIDIFTFNEYISYYAAEYKYPLMVIEESKKNILKPKIKLTRADIEDPFRKYEFYEQDKQFSVDDYQLMKKYGLSPGHNAPAGHHKSSMDNWSSTFYHINMTPQDIVLNSGVWMLLEKFTEDLSKNKTIKSLTVLTGSIPNDKTTNIEGLEVNIPKFMYKILLANYSKYTGKVYIACFLCPNKPIIPEETATDIKKYLIHINKLSTITGLNLNKIVENILIDYFINNPFTNTKRRTVIKLIKTSTKNKKYNKTNSKKDKTKKRITSAKQFKYLFLGNLLTEGIKYKFKHYDKNNLLSSYWFGKIINSKSLNELEQNWQEFKNENETKKFNSTDKYHLEYYNLAKDRLTTTTNKI